MLKKLGTTVAKFKKNLMDDQVSIRTKVEALGTAFDHDNSIKPVFVVFVSAYPKFNNVNGKFAVAETSATAVGYEKIDTVKKNLAQKIVSEISDWQNDLLS